MGEQECPKFVIMIKKSQNVANKRRAIKHARFLHRSTITGSKYILDID